MELSNIMWSNKVDYFLFIIIIIVAIITTII